MISLAVKVEDTETGIVSMYTFARPPVRIGRRTLNNLTLDRPFVSGYHAVIRFDEGGVTLTDLGSRNGTLLDGAPLAKNLPMTVGSETDVRIGTLRLTFAVHDESSAGTGSASAREPRRGSPVVLGAGAAYPDAGSAAANQGPFAVRNATEPNDWNDPAARAPFPPASPFPPATPVPPTPGYPPGPGRSQLPVSPAYAQPGRTRMIVDGDLPADAPPPPPSWTPSNNAPAQKFERVDTAQGPRLPTAAARAPASPVSREAMSRVSPEVLLSTLETFAQGFLELRQTCQEFGDEMGVRPVQGSTPLHRAREPREIVQYLIDPRADRRARLQELRDIFADFGYHEIALVNGVKEGLHRLIAELDPERREEAGKAKAFRVFDGKAMDRYVDHFHQVAEGDGESVVFGTAFKRAYAATAGQRRDRDE